MKKYIQPISMLIVLSVSSLASSQSWGPRGLDELKEETLRRALHGEGPIGVVRMEDAERAVAALHDLERDTWASAWSSIGEEYLERARAAATEGEARENYYYAWRYFDVGRWPTEKHSDGKRESYEQGLVAFGEWGRLLDPPVETVRIPFEDSEIVLYLRLPNGVRPAPLVFGINGLDSRKEGVMAGSDGYIEAGAAASAIDMPGTGQAPILIDVGAERMLSAALDHLAERPEIDGSRIVVQGRSWSGYWAAVLAYTERDRILGAAVHGVGIHHYYQPEWQEHAVLSREYLFDLFPGAVSRLRRGNHGGLSRLRPEALSGGTWFDRSAVSADVAGERRAGYPATHQRPVPDDEERRPQDGLGQPGRRAHGSFRALAGRADSGRSGAAVVIAPARNRAVISVFQRVFTG